MQRHRLLNLRLNGETLNTQALRRSFLGTTGLGMAALLAGGAAPGAPATSQPVAPGGARAGTPAAGERPMKVLSLADVETQAHARMSEAAWAFMAEGSGEQWTLAENRRAFNDFPIVPRRLRGVDGSTVAMGVQLLGHDLPYPIMVAPSGVHPRLLEQYEYRAGVMERVRAAGGMSGERAEHFDVVAAAVSAGRRELLRLHRGGSIHDTMLRVLEAELDLEELTALRRRGDGPSSAA